MSATQAPRGGRGVRASHVIMDEAQHLQHVHYSLGAIRWGTTAPRSAHLVAITLDEAHRAVRHARAIQHRQFELATVIREQPGRQAVRDGMGDVLHWLKECACYDYSSHGRCAWVVQREQEIVEQIGSAMAIATSHVNEMFQRVKLAYETAAPAMRRLSAALGGTDGLSQDDFALAPPPHRTGRAAQRSPYGPQGRSGR